MEPDQVEGLDLLKCRSLLKDALQSLDSRDQGTFTYMQPLILDLRMAAELGESLVHQNEQLKTQLSRSRDSTLNATICSLENSNGALQRRVDTLTDEHAETVSALHKKISTLESQCSQYRETTEQSAAELSRLQDENAQLKFDRGELASNSKKLNSLKQLSQSQYEQKIEELEFKWSTLEQRSEKDRHELLSAEKNNAKLLGQIRKYEEDQQNNQELQLEYDQLRTEYQECNQMLIDTRELVSFLNDQLEAMRTLANDSTAQKSGDATKSLFSEVEDRRAELESKHAKLQRAHVTSVKQRERMRNQINRLSQISHSTASEARVAILENQLAAVSAENRSLELKLTSTENKLALYQNDDYTCISQIQVATTDDAIDFLRMRVNDLTADLERAQVEVRTSNVLRQGEISRLRESEGRAVKLQEELEKIKAVNAQLKFELEELRQAQAELNTDMDMSIDENVRPVSELNLPPPLVKSPIKRSTSHGENSGLNRNKSPVKDDSKNKLPLTISTNSDTPACKQQ